MTEPQLKPTGQELVSAESKSMDYYVWYDEIVMLTIGYVTVMVSVNDFNDFVDGLRKFKAYNKEEFNFDSEHFSFSATSVCDEDFDHIHISMGCGFISLDFTIPADEFLDFFNAFMAAQNKLKDLDNIKVN